MPLNGRKEKVSMKPEMLKVFARNLIKLGIDSDSFRKEVERYNKKKELFSCFVKLLEFDFAKYSVKLLFEADSPEKINIDEVKYEISDKESKKLLISNFS